MFRSTLIVAGAALLCSTAVAQKQIDSSKIFPITSPIRYAGSVDVTTGKWTRGGQPGQTLNAGATVIFNNTCTWTGGAFYGGTEDCEDSYDEGQIPSSTNTDWTAITGNPGTGLVGDNNLVDCFQIAYCTFVGQTAPDIEVSFFDNLGGDCVGATAPTPPAPTSGHPNLSQNGYFDLSLVGLPGSTAVGFQACWIVTLDTTNGVNFCLQADGDGAFDNSGGVDKFTWMFRHNDVNGANPNGFIISGDPISTADYGSCSYNIACGTDPFTATPCGTGFGGQDNEWINIDNVAVGDTQSGLCLGGVSTFGGTNCYFFGGWPANPFASYWLTIEASNACGSPPGGTYCVNEPTSVAGCTPSVSLTGAPSATAGSGAILSSGSIPGGNLGIFFYAHNGPGAVTMLPFGDVCFDLTGGTFRGPPIIGGGTAGVCDGNLSFDWNAYAIGAGGAAVVPGNTVDGQFWYRDPPSPNGAGANFTEAIGFVIGA